MSELLLIDDEQMNLNLFKRRFAQSIPVVTASSGKEALKVLDENPNISIVITDMKMPDMNGIELLQILMEKKPAIKRYLITGLNETEEIKQIAANGLVEKYFFKPIDFQKIKEELF